jgi:DNA-directed RNA polymerase specialized sigma24 family protein
MPSIKNTLDFHQVKIKSTERLLDIADKRVTAQESYDLRDFICTLSPYGEMFIEYHIGGYTLQDLATKYDMSPNSVKRHLKNTQERLKEKYV